MKNNNHNQFLKGYGETPAKNKIQMEGTFAACVPAYTISKSSNGFLQMRLMVTPGVYRVDDELTAMLNKIKEMETQK